MRKLIKMSHNVYDYECMWNGIEDMYEDITGEHIPDFLFFSLSGIGNFVYLKHNKGPLKRQVCWGDGRTELMYKSVCDIIGFDFKHIQGRTFAYTMKKAKSQIDMEKPVVLGCLDMYYLKYYPKFYHKEHITIHYVLMVGYDEEKNCALIQDCGVKEVQEISFEELEIALDVEKTDLSDKNGIYLIEWKDKLKGLKELCEEALKRKADSQLNPPVSFLGIKGMRKLAMEFPGWKDELTREELKAAIEFMAMFTGTVPSIPEKLINGVEGKEEIPRMAAMDKFSGVLNYLGVKYEKTSWVKAGEAFMECGRVIERMSEVLVDYLMGARDAISEIPGFLEQQADFEEQGYKYIIDGVKE